MEKVSDMLKQMAREEKLKTYLSAALAQFALKYGKLTIEDRACIVRIFGKNLPGDILMDILINCVDKKR